MKIAINYADNRFIKSQKYNTKTAIEVGKFDKVIEYSPDNLDDDISDRFRKWIYSNDRQVGKYGLWRPYIILKTLKEASYNDYICYVDSGVYFIDSIDHLINCMEEYDEDIMSFELPFVERQWTKRDIFLYFDSDKEKIYNTCQRLSTIILIKKTKTSLEIFEKYYEASIKMPELFTDEDNRFNELNYNDFIENRHNQSVLSVLLKKYGKIAFRDPSEYGNNPFLYKIGISDKIEYKVSEYNNSYYPQIIVQHRSGKVGIKEKALGLLRSKADTEVIRFIYWIRDSIKRK